MKHITERIKRAGMEIVKLNLTLAFVAFIINLSLLNFNLLEFLGRSLKYCKVASTIIPFVNFTLSGNQYNIKITTLKGCFRQKLEFTLLFDETVQK